MTEKDYSHVPLSRKLGIKPGSTVLLLDAPVDATAWIAPLPDGAAVRDDAETADVIVVFGTDAGALRANAVRMEKQLSIAGGLWLCWPKRTSGIATDATFEAVQRIGLDAGLVDNKSISVSPQWSGMRFVRRLRDRPTKR